MKFFKQPIQLKTRIPIIKNKIEDKINVVINIHNANPKANYLNSIRQNISNDVLKKYVDLYTILVIKVKDIHHRGCMNHLSSETNTILFYELCKVIQSSFILFCEEDAEDINSYLLKKRCHPNHKPFTDFEKGRISEDIKKLTKKHISFIEIKDIFIAVLLYYCDCNKTDISDKTQYMLEYILPEIESDLSIYLYSILSYSNNVECQQGGKKCKRSDIHKQTQRRRRYKKKTRKW
jgi:hypothetical protein